MPLVRTPVGAVVTRPQDAARYVILREALLGVDLTDDEDRILWWLAEWEVGTVRTVAAIIGKARTVPGALRSTHTP